MKPIFCRIGSKSRVAKNIIKYFPYHDTYVEPFVGSGAVFFRKDKVKNEVINDLDKDLINAYKLIKSVTEPQFENFKSLKTLKQKQEFVNTNPTTTAGKLYKNILLSCNTFSSNFGTKLYKNPHQFTKIKNIEKYKDRLKGTKILNQDYKNILKKYDSPNTLFYLDPPYENSKNIYDKYYMDYEDLELQVRNLKGAVVISMNDSPNIRKIFKNYKIVKIDETTNRKFGSISTSRVDILIMNYIL